MLSTAGVASFVCSVTSPPHDPVPSLLWYPLDQSSRPPSPLFFPHLLLPLLIMALLFEKSASWRRLVAATRNPRVMAAFTAASVAAAAGVAIATQSVTDATGGAASTATASATVARDWEAARYAAHSKRALGVLFDDVRGSGESATAGGGGGGSVGRRC